MNTRFVAAKILTEVIRDKRSLTEVLKYKIPPSLPDRDHSLVKEICYGTLRYYHRLKVIADLLVYKPIKSREQELLCLLLIGLYQLIYLQTPAYAALSETVAATHFLKKSWAKGLINQALHQFLKAPDFFLQKADETPVGKFSHPEWLILDLQKAWPNQWSEILLANNQHPPLFLRVNVQKNSREEYLQRLTEKEIKAVIVEDLPQALRLEQAISVEKLPGFFDGSCSVQDLASQYIINFLDLAPGQSVLDACAAPGGKSSHILETMPRLSQFTAIDHDMKRLKLVEENLKRLKLKHDNIRFCHADAAKTETWWDGKLFDRILLDAPCSGTGVIRRHPDIKILREPEDIARYKEQQLQLLSALWPLLKSGGRLVYTTCSVLPEENEKMVFGFCQEHPDANPQSIALKTGFPQKIGYQLLPSPELQDGFYYAVLNKA